MNQDGNAPGVADAKLPSGKIVRVRVADAPSGLSSVGRADAVKLEDALAPIGEVADLMREKLASLEATRATVEFGVSLSAQSGKLTSLIFEAKADASLTVTLEWERKRP
jgi:Trypsin-co-occurring domain 1